MPRPYRPSISLVRLLAGILMAASVLAGGSLGSTAAAQQAPGAPPASGAPPTTAPASTPAMAPNTWALSPTGDDPTQPSSRAFFSFELAKGTTTRDSVTLWNYSENELTFDVYARDAFNTPEGGFDLLRAAQAPTDVGSWISLEQNRLIVPARSGIPIPFTMTVPANATPGDHAGGIVASVARSGGDGGNKQVTVDHRVGTRVYLRVPGALNQTLEIERIESSYPGSVNPVAGRELVVTYTVRNAGNTRLRARQQVATKGLVGWPSQEQTLEDLPELLPGASITRTHRFESVVPAIRLTTDLTLTPYGLDATGGGGAPLDPVSRSTALWAVPWLLLGIVAAGLGAWRFRARRARRDPAPASADAAQVPDVAPADEVDALPV